VALTRAEERLYICGWEPHQTLSNACWYSLCHQGLAQLADSYSFDFRQDIADGWQGTGLRFYQPPQEALPQGTLINKETVKDEILIPSFLMHPAPYEAPKERPKTASHAESSAPISQPSVSQERGTYLHKLLEILPTIEKEVWSDTAQRLLLDYPAVEDSEILYQQVISILQKPEWDFIFGPQSWPEVPVLGTIDGTFYSTQIDRLVVEKDRVLIIDYKSNQKMPQTLSEVPQAYITQLAIYQKLIQALYPDKKVETYLLWTQRPALMKIHN
jgi:ATP-dependent helicase/nuclease subunit A